MSAGYQRLFADGELVRLVSKAKRTAMSRLVGVKDNFVENHFNSVFAQAQAPLDELEDEWQRLENVAIPRVAVLDPGTFDEADEYAVKVLVAIHFARSYALRDMQKTLSDAALNKFLEHDIDRDALATAWREEYGTDPKPEDIDRAAVDFWTARQATQVDFVETMVKGHNFALDFLQTLYLQPVVLGPRMNTELGTGDSPVVATNPGLTQLGIRHGLALGDSGTLYMPLRRDLGVSFTTRLGPPLQLNTSAEVYLLNNLVWRNSSNFVACHPAAQWRRLWNL